MGSWRWKSSGSTGTKPGCPATMKFGSSPMPAPWRTASTWAKMLVAWKLDFGMGSCEDRGGPAPPPGAPTQRRTQSRAARRRRAFRAARAPRRSRRWRRAAGSSWLRKIGWALLTSVRPTTISRSTPDLFWLTFRVALSISTFSRGFRRCSRTSAGVTNSAPKPSEVLIRTRPERALWSCLIRPESDPRVSSMASAAATARRAELGQFPAVRASFQGAAAQLPVQGDDSAGDGGVGGAQGFRDGVEPAQAGDGQQNQQIVRAWKPTQVQARLSPYVHRCTCRL